MLVLFEVHCPLLWLCKESKTNEDQRERVTMSPSHQKHWIGRNEYDFRRLRYTQTTAVYMYP